MGRLSPLSPQARNLNKPPKVNYLKNSINITLKSLERYKQARQVHSFGNSLWHLLILRRGEVKRLMRLYAPLCGQTADTDLQALTDLLFSSFHNIKFHKTSHEPEEMS